MKQKSLKINYFYNMLLTSLNLVFPLITAPYVSRVLGADNLGKVNFASAFVNWFILLSAFGTTTYGLREVAKVKNDREELNKVFSELLVVKGIATFALIIVYFLIILNISKFSLELNLYLVFSINILLNILNIDWFYQGMENYKYITIRSSTLKLISLLAMFIMVKDEKNYILYGAISIFATSFGNVLNYLYSRNFVSFILKGINIKKHLNKLFIFFISSLIISCYTTLDQVLVGFLINDRAVAFISRSKQIVNIGISITLALSTVIIPRATFYYENNREQYNRLIKNSINYIYILALPCMAGIMLLSKETMILLGGKDFIQASGLLSIMSINIFVSAIGNWNYNQILLPTGNEKKGLQTQFIMAIISIFLNFILLNKIGYVGAGITAVGIEVLGTLINLIYTKRFKNYRIITSEFIKYIMATFLMILVILFIKSKVSSYLVIIAVSLIVSPIIYFGVLIALREKNTLQVLNLIKNKII